MNTYNFYIEAHKFISNNIVELEGLDIILEENQISFWESVRSFLHLVFREIGKFFRTVFRAIFGISHEYIKALKTFGKTKANKLKDYIEEILKSWDEDKVKKLQELKVDQLNFLRDWKSLTKTEDSKFGISIEDSKIPKFKKISGNQSEWGKLINGAKNFVSSSANNESNKKFLAFLVKLTEIAEKWTEEDFDNIKLEVINLPAIMIGYLLVLTNIIVTTSSSYSVINSLEKSDKEKINLVLSFLTENISEKIYKGIYETVDSLLVGAVITIHSLFHIKIIKKGLEYEEVNKIFNMDKVRKIFSVYGDLFIKNKSLPKIKDFKVDNTTISTKINRIVEDQIDLTEDLMGTLNIEKFVDKISEIKKTMGSEKKAVEEFSIAIQKKGLFDSDQLQKNNKILEFLNNISKIILDLLKVVVILQEAIKEETKTLNEINKTSLF